MQMIKWVHAAGLNWRAGFEFLIFRGRLEIKLCPSNVKIKCWLLSTVIIPSTNQPHMLYDEKLDARWNCVLFSGQAAYVEVVYIITITQVIARLDLI